MMSLMRTVTTLTPSQVCNLRCSATTTDSTTDGPPSPSRKANLKSLPAKIFVVFRDGPTKQGFLHGFDSATTKNFVSKQRTQ